jgi:hypothetical protein
MRLREMFRETEEGEEPSALRDQGQRAGAVSLLLPFLRSVLIPELVFHGHSDQPNKKESRQFWKCFLIFETSQVNLLY